MKNLLIALALFTALAYGLQMYLGKAGPAATGNANVADEVLKSD